LTEPLNLLLVEDSADDAELVLMELQRHGLVVQARRVDSAAAMAEALAVAPWDLVLSDYRIPGFGGLDALRLVQASGRDIPFILVSGAIGEEQVVAAMKAGAHSFVAKHNLARLGPTVDRELKDAAVRSEERRAKEELRASEERYRSLFERSPIPLAELDCSELQTLLGRWRGSGVKDFQGFFLARPHELRRCAEVVRFREGNEAGKRFFGYPGQPGQPAGFGAIFLDRSWPVFRELLCALAAGAAAFQSEVPLRTLAGEERTVTLFLTVNRGCERTLERVLISIMDVTDRIRMEGALRDLDLLSVKGRMAAYIAHEINNPLAGIKNAFALLEPAIPADHPHHRYADLIRREIDRIAGIIRTMYRVYRPPAGDTGEVALREVFEDILNLLEPKCRSAAVTISLDLPEPEFTVRTNGSLLRQIIFNLAQNAVEASDHDGVVVLGGRRGLDRVEITVRDQGTGIPPELALQVFEPGFTTKVGDRMSGLGLGLSTCKRIVASLGGTLAFEAADPGPGCVFRVSFPALEPAHA
jgi:signal transduction histidine kinase/FixJ family two-component response regulator